jgi:hypothetical protein
LLSLGGRSHAWLSSRSVTRSTHACRRCPWLHDDNRFRLHVVEHLVEVVVGKLSLGRIAEPVACRTGVQGQLGLPEWPHVSLSRGLVLGSRHVPRSELARPRVRPRGQLLRLRRDDSRRALRPELRLWTDDWRQRSVSTEPSDDAGRNANDARELPAIRS